MYSYEKIDECFDPSTGRKTESYQVASTPLQPAEFSVIHPPIGVSGFPGIPVAMPLAPGQPPQIKVGAGYSSPAPRFELIPSIGLIRLADRFELGEINKGDKAWNAMSANQEILSDKTFLCNRLGHVIGHALMLLDKVIHDRPFDDDDDAAAIAWAGVFAICATDAMQKQRKKELDSEPTNGLNDAITTTEIRATQV